MINTLTGKPTQDIYYPRQALSTYALSLEYKLHPSLSNRKVIERNLDFFENKPIPDNNTNSILLIALINYLEQEPSAKLKYSNLLNRLSEQLLISYLPNGSFIQVVGKSTVDDFNNGESLYAAIRFYEFSHDLRFLSLAKNSANFFMNYYSQSKLNEAFFIWGTQGFYYLYKNDPQDKYWLFIKKMTDQFFKERGLTAERYYFNDHLIPPTLDIVGFLEPLSFVADIARKQDPELAQRITSFYLQSLDYVSQFQINGTSRFSSNPQLTGSYCENYTCLNTRLDRIGHAVGAYYYYFHFIRKPNT